jgi:hypothetical protein
MRTTKKTLAATQIDEETKNLASSGISEQEIGILAMKYIQNLNLGSPGSSQTLASEFLGSTATQTEILKLKSKIEYRVKTIKSKGTEQFALEVLEETRGT